MHAGEVREDDLYPSPDDGCCLRTGDNCTWCNEGERQQYGEGDVRHEQVDKLWCHEDDAAEEAQPCASIARLQDGGCCHLDCWQPARIEMILDEMKSPQLRDIGSLGVSYNNVEVISLQPWYAVSRELT